MPKQATKMSYPAIKDELILSVKNQLTEILALVSEGEFIMLQRYGQNELMARVRDLRLRLAAVLASL